MPAPTFETDRLVLRPLLEEDLEPLLEVYRTPELRRWLHLDEEPSREDVWRMMAVWRGMWELRGCGQLAVIERATGRVVGRAGTHLPEREDWPGIEVGWALHPDVWGSGVADELMEMEPRQDIPAQTDEAPPLGKGTGPNPARMLGAAIGPGRGQLAAQRQVRQVVGRVIRRHLAELLDAGFGVHGQP